MVRGSVVGSEGRISELTVRGRWGGRHSMRSTLLVLTMLGGAVAGADAQTLTSGVIEGVVRDTEGVPLDGVSIRLTHRESAARILLTGSRAGRFATGPLPPGTWDGLFERFGYDPVEVRGLEVEPGRRVSLPVVLPAVAGDVARPRVVQAAGVTRSGLSAGWLTGGELTVPLEAGALPNATLLSTNTDDAGGVTGLPSTFTGVLIDGVPMAPRASSTRLLAARAFPLLMLSDVGVRSRSGDVEWAAGAGAFIAGFTAGGGGETRARVAGDFGSDATAGLLEQDPASFQSYRGGARIGLPLLGDTTTLAIGVEAARTSAAFGPLWTPSASGTIGTGPGAIDLTAEQIGYAPQTDRISGFARLDHRFSPENRLSIFAFGAVLPQSDLVRFTDPRGRAAFSRKERELLASVTLGSVLGETLDNELTLAFESGRSEAEPGLAGTGVRTVLVDPGITFGSSWLEGSSSQVTSLYLRETLFYRSGDHRVKVGVSALLPSYSVDPGEAAGGEFVFADAASFAQRDGYFRQALNPPTTAEFSLRTLSLYAQDSWSPSAGLELTAGLRWTLMQFPDTSDIPQDADWVQHSGVLSTVPEAFGELEPRFEFTWRSAGSGGVQVGGFVDVTLEALSPGLMAEMTASRNGALVRAGEDVFANYPQPPATDLALNRRVLTLLGPEFRPPRSTRAGATLGFTPAAGLRLGAGVEYRATDFLPRRRDVNLADPALRTDQHGRPLYGELAKSGGIVRAGAPLGSRRFRDFDRVSAIEAVGSSKYTGFNLSMGYAGVPWLRLDGSYTYSTTEDDWLAGPLTGIGEQAPFGVDEPLASWADDVSDLDVPHRLVLAAGVTMPVTLRPSLSLFYRHASAYPFTPGFREGVDVNADGESNDPAYIDSGVAGMGELIAAWPCLGESQGAFAARNSCRGEDRKALDARLGIALLDRGTSSVRLSLVVDALNLIASGGDYLDRAVYLIDPAVSLSVNPTTGVVTIPLRANPGFGEPLVQRDAQRVLRLGLRLDY